MAGSFDLARFRDSRVLSDAVKHSASPSAIAFARELETGLQVAIKAFPVYPEAYLRDRVRAGDQPGDQQALRALMNQGLEYEACVYQRTLPTLDGTPHLVQPLGILNADMSSEATGLVVALWDSLTRSLKPAERSTITGLRLVVTERRPKTRDLNAYLQNASEAATCAAMFQLLYTIHVLTRTDVQNHDLHFGNVLVDLAPEEDSIAYQVNGAEYHVPVAGAKLMVFDWDRAFALRSCGTNPLLDGSSCGHVSSCSTLNRKYDLIVVLTMLAFALEDAKGYPPRPEAAGFVTMCFQGQLDAHRTLIDQKTSRPCNWDRSVRQCVPWQTTDPTWVVTVEEALAMPYFERFRVRSQGPRPLHARPLVQASGVGN